MTFSTHEVFNQPPPFEDVNLYGSDAALKEAVAREGGGGGRVAERCHIGLTAPGVPPGEPPIESPEGRNGTNHRRASLA